MAIKYTEAISVAMDDTNKHIAAINTAVDDLDMKIQPFVQASQGAAFPQLQEVIRIWRGGATEHTGQQMQYVRTVQDGKTNMHDTDNRVRNLFT